MWVLVVGVGVGGRVDVCGYVLEIWIENHPFAICVFSKRKGDVSLAFEKTRPELPPHPHVAAVRFHGEAFPRHKGRAPASRISRPF